MCIHHQLLILKTVIFEDSRLAMKHALLSFLIFTPILMGISSCNQREPKQSGSVTNKPESHLQQPLSVVTACIFSEIAYCKEPQKMLDQYLPGWKIVWDPGEVNGNYAFLASDGNSYVLAIRGSLIQFSWAAFDNWIYNDLNVANQKDWTYTNNVTGAKISQGSYDGWQNLNKMTDKKTKKNLWAFLQANVNEKDQLTITGHSLGGNLAAVYSSYVWKKYKDSGHPKDNINVITFAAPAAGNKNFADDFNAKFPNSLRVENIHDMVPKFPVTEKVSDLGKLFSPSPSADSITVGYKNATVKLSNVFITVGAALQLLRVTNGISPYVQTNGLGDLITVNISGKDTANTIMNWFAEAAYQHSINQYAAQLGAPVINCDQ